MLLEAVLLLLGAGVLLGLALLVYVHHAQGFWKRRGVVTLPAKTRFLGNFGELVLRTKAFPYVIKDFYDEIKQMGVKFAGVYQFTRPQLFVVDPDIIREITVTHFDHFTDRRPFATVEVDELLGRSLLNLQGDEWRHMRHQLTPAFTGAKLRSMTHLIERTCRQLARFLSTRAEPEEPLDMNMTLRRFAADVICSTAFGTPCDSLQNEEQTSPFYEHGIKLMDTSGLRGLVFAGYLTSPKLMQFLKIPFIPSALDQFFRNTILSTIRYRQTENKSRPDMIQLLLEARKQDAKDGKTGSIPDRDIIAQAFTFFLGGFDTVATSLSFCSQLLAMHPEVQQRLREEVDEAFQQGGGNIAYEAVGDLKYMDMVLSEVLRLYPPAPMVDRQCCKAFELPEYGLRVEKGVSVAMSIVGMHYDPEIFPDPEKFDPERFTEENKKSIPPNTYLPFGIGPRNCIGLRFAQLEVKLCLAYMLGAAELEVCELTQVPIKLSAQSTQLKPEGGFWLRVRPRDTPAYTYREE